MEAFDFAGLVCNIMLYFSDWANRGVSVESLWRYYQRTLNENSKAYLCRAVTGLYTIYIKNALKKEIPSRATKAPDFVIIDGCAILWIIHWPTSGTLSSYVKGFLKYVLDKASQNDTALIFDRYNEYSIKSVKQGMSAND